ncbi:DEAD/DEAH box helicase [Sphingobacterium sp. DR205]|uniref:DEAD/DEAH box helicase n=1 Tax=Sphingobacterium sp. DR205 TaxID=2713573 RepID=UPI0013E4AFE0|nr:DEAD/DEAH box helicase [Sphingobacterium sp. DR205]QIH32408.1 DEAD/DEAH box helicase [Sphingobacterium sp. DR205]
MNFSTLQLNKFLFSNLEKQKLSVLTAVQEQVIPALLDGKDCLAIAPTGTGKTEAFAIPLVQHLLEKDQNEHASVLILLPTRELCIQTKDRIAKLIEGTSLNIACFYGGGTYESQLAAYPKAQLILATPGRLLDFLEQQLIDLKSINTLVIDEFDQLLDLGFALEINKIMLALPTERQSIFVSATRTAEMDKIIHKRLKNPIEIVVENPLKKGKIHEYVLYVDKNDKKNLIRYLLEDRIKSQVLIFTRTVHAVERIEADLQRNGVSALALYGDKSQQQREDIVSKFRNKENRVLIATDLLARGMDFPNLEAIINYEVPDSPETYTHRIGRTGRSQADGIAITLCDAEDNQKWIKLQLALNKQIQIDDQHPFLLSWEKMLSSSQSNTRKGQSKSRKRR